MRSFILSIALATCLWSAPIGGVAILVKNSPITLYEIQQEMKLSGTSAKQSADILIRKKLEQLEASEKKITVSSKEIDEELSRMAAQNNLSQEQFLNAMQTMRGLSEKDLRAKVEESIKGQKLYSAIAFSKMAQPTAEEEAEYYQLHLDEFSHPESFDVTTYVSPTQEALAAKIADPMHHIEMIQSKEESLPYATINPQLAQILNKTATGSFSPILPNGKNGFMSFYIREKNNVITENLESVRPQISNAIINEKRNQVLNDYFARLRLNADIKILRLP
ncbi:peptidylprolyl isomerase [Sulfuricurvum sp.]|uniref:peptidylprolyl isomerase n=1 Tax=Sulfuricurvum sp. TaxID=2025608 RepID=UPI0019BE7E82|nr:peptidylprolyl isomerase [Sulfuricurvum sp.]MBD3798715.1 peptidyl-prolyl cis-trans isomerase [Campylobacterota bacterium]MBD3805957.1 peptidyl-prolyl cis-trans isomerase [Sulfuricurvum sp.]